MAATGGINATHDTLSGATADTVTMTGQGGSLAITNRDASVTLYFRFGSTAAVADADENFAVLPLQTKVLGVGTGDASIVISIVGNGNAYSVEVF
jgi:hypothetical protein